MVQGMKRPAISKLGTIVVSGLALLSVAPGCVAAEPSPAAVAAFDTYVGVVELRLAREHGAGSTFPLPVDAVRLRRGELILEQITPASRSVPAGAMLHDWRGTAFVAGAKAADFERLMKNFDAYPQYFAPEVVQAKVTAQLGDHMQATMRVRQKHVITVVMDTAYDVTFARLDAQHGYSISRSTRIAEIDAAGTVKERALTADEEQGFLWRLNTYWSYEERGGGLYMQVESVSLTRAIPTGLGWAIGPFVESVPRDSLEFTLRATCMALRK
jgi:hypothetical protein